MSRKPASAAPVPGNAVQRRLIDSALDPDRYVRLTERLRHDPRRVGPIAAAADHAAGVAPTPAVPVPG